MGNIYTTTRKLYLVGQKAITGRTIDMEHCVMTIANFTHLNELMLQLSTLRLLYKFTFFLLLNNFLMSSKLFNF